MDKTGLEQLYKEFIAPGVKSLEFKLKDLEVRIQKLETGEREFVLMGRPSRESEKVRVEK